MGYRDLCGRLFRFYITDVISDNADLQPHCNRHDPVTVATVGQHEQFAIFRNHRADHGFHAAGLAQPEFRRRLSPNQEKVCRTARGIHQRSQDCEQLRKPLYFVDHDQPCQRSESLLRSRKRRPVWCPFKVEVVDRFALGDYHPRKGCLSGLTGAPFTPLSGRLPTQLKPDLCYYACSHA